MGHSWTDDIPPPPPGGNNEHPIVATIAVIAIVAAILLIAWARIELHGTAEIEAALAEPTPAQAPAPDASPASEENEPHDTAASSRFATGFSP